MAAEGGAKRAEPEEERKASEPAKAQKTNDSSRERKAVAASQPGFALVCSAGRERQALDSTLPLLRDAVEGAGASLERVRSAGGGTAFVALSAHGVGSHSGPSYGSKLDPVSLLLPSLRSLPGRIEAQPCQRLLPAQDVLPLDDKDSLCACASRLVHAALHSCAYKHDTHQQQQSERGDERGAAHPAGAAADNSEKDAEEGVSERQPEESEGSAPNAAAETNEKTTENSNAANASKADEDERRSNGANAEDEKAEEVYEERNDSKKQHEKEQNQRTTYGVGIRTRRMTDEKERQEVINSLAQGVESALGKGNYKVDLTSPSCALIAEALPASLSETGKPLVAMSWLQDKRLFTTKGRLQIKPFNVDTAMQFCSFD